MVKAPLVAQVLISITIITTKSNHQPDIIFTDTIALFLICLSQMCEFDLDILQMQILVHGDSLQAYLVAVIVPDPEAAKKWATENGLSVSILLRCHPKSKHTIW